MRGIYPKETFIKRINAGFYLGWPGLTAARVRKHLPKSEATTLGHQILVRQGIRPTVKKLRSKIHDVSVTVIDTEKMSQEMKNLIPFDLPGRFPIVSGSGHK